MEPFLKGWLTVAQHVEQNMYMSKDTILAVQRQNLPNPNTNTPRLGECTSDPLTSKVITSSTHNLKVTHTFYIGFSPTTRATAASMPTLVFEETMRPLARPGPVHALEMPIMLRLVRIDNRKLQC